MGNILESFNPLVSNSHMQTIVKTNTTILKRNTKSWHSTDLKRKKKIQEIKKVIFVLGWKEYNPITDFYVQTSNINSVCYGVIYCPFRIMKTSNVKCDCLNYIYCLFRIMKTSNSDSAFSLWFTPNRQKKIRRKNSYFNKPSLFCLPYTPQKTKPIRHKYINEVWHTYIFTYRYSFRKEPMNHIINQHQIRHSIDICCVSKILIVVPSKWYLSWINTLVETLCSD